MAFASILFASKSESSNNKLGDICKEYISIPNKRFESENLIKIKNHIEKYELLIVKELKFDMPTDLPYDFINVYSDILYPDNSEDIANFASKIACDSFFTYANNIYKNYVVALASLVIAAKFLNIPTILDDNFKYIKNMKKFQKKNISEIDFCKALFEYDGKNIDEDNDDGYFEGLELSEKLYPNMKMDDLFDCVKMILEFYEDMNNPK
jgi:hypothetical protein